MQCEERRNLYATGSGPSTCRPMSPSLALVGAAASHVATRLANPYDSDGAHTSQPVLSRPPARIFENITCCSSQSYQQGKVPPLQDCMLCHHLWQIPLQVALHTLTQCLLKGGTCNEQRQQLLHRKTGTLSLAQTHPCHRDRYEAAQQR
ncbi:hypothetical protein HPB52_023693 [Rhipicephalus sanguineus]|uniref:Uncharacterized protein n=1 Tax=Rhipicephalus sanguineus TaxID=34632 RepID=A0A9D4YR60_RHISA|nr:hypothetical protein HPB52_023693 [Rhipicephalus sanguineus]